MNVITVASLKGGVGKTTTAVHLALALHRAGKRVLAVDLDANNNLTDFFLRSAEPEDIDSAGAYHVLARKLEITACVRKTSSGVDVLPGSPSLNRLSGELAANPGPLLAFGPRLRKTAYDVVVIDTPPYAGPELRAALYAADLVAAPVCPVRWVFQGTQLLFEELETVQDAAGRAPGFVFLASMTGRSAGEAAKLALLTREYAVLKTVVHRSGALRSSAEKSRPLKENTQPYLEFQELAKEVLEWLSPLKKKPVNG